MEAETRKKAKNPGEGIVISLLKKELFGVSLILLVGIIAYALLFLVMILF